MLLDYVWIDGMEWNGVV